MGFCGHIDTVTCDNCRPQVMSLPFIQPYQPVYTYKTLEDYLKNSPKSEEPKMTIEKVENGLLVKYKGKTYVFDMNFSSNEQLGNLIIDLIDRVEDAK